MAERKVASKEETKTAAKTTKKVATGSTKKMVQKRSSSVAAKKTAPKKEVAETTSTKKTTTKKTSSKTGGAAKKEAPKKKTTTKKETALKAKKEIENKIEVFEEETKENFTSILKATGQDKPLKEQKNKESKVKQEVVDNQEEIEEPRKAKKDLSIKEMAEIEKAVKKEMKANRKMPEQQLEKMATRIFKNMLLAIIVMIYLNFIILGFLNIENDIFITDLKVFSIAILIIGVGIIEFAYRKKSGRAAIHGIEFVFLALATLGLLYVNLTWVDKFIPIAVLATYAFSIYYLIKDAVVYRKMKKKYFVESMKEMIRR
ncbi:MAG: hypothetical protein HFJ28_00550 [Clostridia bacterium]|nr:hypothetical protein [Clostridia bacterium]